MRQEQESTVSFTIPTSLVRKIEKRIKGTDFESVSSYITYILTEILAETVEEEVEDLKTVKAELRDMGYID